MDMNSDICKLEFSDIAVNNMLQFVVSGAVKEVGRDYRVILRLWQNDGTDEPVNIEFFQDALADFPQLAHIEDDWGLDPVYGMTKAIDIIQRTFTVGAFYQNIQRAFKGLSEQQIGAMIRRFLTDWSDLDGEGYNTTELIGASLLMLDIAMCREQTDDDYLSTDKIYGLIV